MKRLLILLMVHTIVTKAFSQKTNLTGSDYLTKSKHQKTTGTVLLITGTAMTTAGFIPASTAAKDSRGTGDRVGAALLLVGGITADLISIPFFVAASKNRKRAAAVTLKSETIRDYYNAKNSIINYPALSLAVHF